MNPYFWMTDFTPQKEWIDGKGLLLWLAFFFSEVGAGVYVVSLFLEFRAGCVAGWIVCALLGGGLHTAYLGKPERAWRAILRPGSSELSRGIIILGLFLVVGALQLAIVLGLFNGLPWEGNALFFKVVLGILGFFVITHGFMTMSSIGALPFWNSGMMPVLSLASGVWVGAQITGAMAMGLGNAEVPGSLEPVARWFFFAYALLTLFYLWNAAHGPMAAKRSLQLLLKGELAWLFYTGVVLIAMVIPLIITLVFCTKPVGEAHGLLWLRAFCAVAGDLVLRYCIFKAARYLPLINSNILTGMHPG